MKKSVAIKYDQSLPAPFILAKGKGQLAEKIIRIASDHNIAIEENEELAKNLMEFEIGSFIPEEYYSIMAHILVFVKYLESKG